MQYRQLIINPGSTSTKAAVYEDDVCRVQETIPHSAEELAAFDTIAQQAPLRAEAILDFVHRNGFRGSDFDAVMGRGGLILPGLHTGGYLVNEELFTALSDNRYSSPHASNLGGILAKLMADPVGIPAYIYDAVTSSELQKVAQITGFPDITRQSFCHVLNSRAMAIAYAKEIGRSYRDLNLIVAHLGGGITASVHSGGKIIDSMGDDDGQFSPERSGSVPALQLIELCYSGNYTRHDMQKKVRGKGGMLAHLGTSDCRKIEEMIRSGDEHADLIFEAQAYQVAKAIGLLSVVLKGNCDAIIITGGLAYSEMFIERLRAYISFLAPVVVKPGEHEMQALAEGGLRILKGEEEAGIYHLPVIKPEKAFSGWKIDW